MKAVILCGGKGLRMKEITDDMPKPMALVGGIPILAHIMDIYSSYGVDDFVLLLGYKGERIKEYFMSESWRDNDFVLDTRGKCINLQLLRTPKSRRITFLDTGEDTMTGSRLKLAEKYINEDVFMLTYGDGICDVDINKLLAFHKISGKIGVLTGIKRKNPFGVMQVTGTSVKGFSEKPDINGWINGGFFVFKREFFNYLDEGKECILEQEPLMRLSKDGQLGIYKHRGYWNAIDTYKELSTLNENWHTIKEIIYKSGVR